MTKPGLKAAVNKNSEKWKKVKTTQYNAYWTTSDVQSVVNQKPPIQQNIKVHNAHDITTPRQNEASAVRPRPTGDENWGDWNILKWIDGH